MRENAMPVTDQPDVVTSLAIEAYSAYSQVVEGYLNTEHTGVLAVQWDLLPYYRQEAWKAAVTAVQTELQNHAVLVWEAELDEWTLVDEQAALNDVKETDPCCM